MDMPLRLVATLRPACLRESKQSLVRSRRRRCARARARLDRCPCRPDTGTDVVSSKRAPEWSEVKWSGEEVEKGGRVPGRRSREREWILLCSLSLCLFTTSPVESKGAASRRGSLSCLATAPRDRDPARQALGGAQLTKQRTTFPSQARRAIGRSWQRDDEQEKLVLDGHATQLDLDLGRSESSEQRGTGSASLPLVNPSRGTEPTRVT